MQQVQILSVARVEVDKIEDHHTLEPLVLQAPALSCWWKNAFVNQPLAKVDAVIEIDLQSNDGGPSVRRSSHQYRTIPAKMPRPLVTAGMEQRNDLLHLGINPGNIRPFVTIVRKTG
jgi:hypothetical protein